jgi:hypothetical protein
VDVTRVTLSGLLGHPTIYSELKASLFTRASLSQYEKELPMKRRASIF